MTQPVDRLLPFVVLLASLALEAIAVFYNAVRRPWPSCMAATRDLEDRYQTLYSLGTLGLVIAMVWALWRLINR